MTKEQLKDLEGLLFRYYSAQVEAKASGIEYDFDAKLPIIDFISKLNKEAVEEERQRILENVVYDLDRLNSDWKAKVEWIGSELQRYKDEYSEDLQDLHPNSKDEIINKDN